MAAQTIEGQRRKSRLMIWATDPSSGKVKKTGYSYFLDSIRDLTIIPWRMAGRVAEMGFRISKRWWEDLHTDTKHKVMFSVATILGMITFWTLFESFETLYWYTAPKRDGFAMFPYVAAYLLSTVWQHWLNRLLVFSEGAYCESLFQTIFVYSGSLVYSTIWHTSSCTILAFRLESRWF